MGKGQSDHRDRRSREVSSEPWPAEHEAAGRGPAETAFEALFACSSLTHSLALALQTEGVNASIEPCAAGPRESVIHIPAGKEEAAIAILLQTLLRSRRRHGGSTPPARGLAA